MDGGRDREVAIAIGKVLLNVLAVIGVVLSAFVSAMLGLARRS